MYTLEDYLFFRGDLSFDAAPVNEVDELVFAAMGNADYTGLLKANETGRYADVFGRYFDGIGDKEDERTGLIESPILMKILHGFATCSRYADIEIGYFEKKVRTENTEQISAMTVIGPNGRIYVTFRGTDDTFVGWKENCELAILDSVPAQRDAAAYLTKVAGALDGPISVSGHSKGGNLAVYAATHVCEEIQDRIEKVVSYDGPGFLNDFFEKPGYLRVKDRIRTVVPRGSFVGMLMDHAGVLDVVECEKEGPRSHDIFFWNLTSSALVRAQSLSEQSQVFHSAMDQALKETDKDDRQEIVNEIFQVLSSTGASSFLDLTEQSFTQALKLSASFYKAKEIKQFMLLVSRFSIKDAVKAIWENLNPND